MVEPVPSTRHPNFVTYILALLLQSKFYRFVAISTSCVYFIRKLCEVKEHNLTYLYRFWPSNTLRFSFYLSSLQSKHLTYIHTRTANNENLVFNAGSLKIKFSTKKIPLMLCRTAVSCWLFFNINDNAVKVKSFRQTK